MSAGSSAGRGVRVMLLFVLGAVVLVGLIVFFTKDDSSGSNVDLDPEGWRRNGGHALAALLEQQGVEVKVVRTVAEARGAATADTLTLVTGDEFLSSEDSLREVGDLPGDRMIVAPYWSMSQYLVPAATERTTLEREPREPSCGWSGAVRAGDVEIGGYAYTAPDTLASCYAGTVLRYRHAGRTITIVGDRDFMTNAKIADRGAAALALNLVGTRQSVVWLAPTTAQGGGAKVGPDVTDLVPDQVWWAMRALVVALVLTALWQARRLGPVVFEQLPVVVRASETAEGLGRLYRARRARDRAALALRRATVARLAPRLGLPAGVAGPLPPAGGGGIAPPARAHEALIAALALRSGREPGEIRAVLYGADPADDRELVGLAEQLEDLEHGVLEGKVRGV